MVGGRQGEEKGEFFCKVFMEAMQSSQITTNLSKFALAPMGVLAPGSAHARPSARPPIDTSRNFSAHMSGGGVKIV